MIIEKGELSLKNITLSFFEFSEKHIDFLLLLKKQNLTYFLLNEFDQLRELVRQQIKPEQANENIDVFSPNIFAFLCGGYWNILNKWLSDSPRKKTEEMAAVIVNLIFEKNE